MSFVKFFLLHENETLYFNEYAWLPYWSQFYLEDVYYPSLTLVLDFNRKEPDSASQEAGNAIWYLMGAFMVCSLGFYKKGARPPLLQETENPQLGYYQVIPS